MLKLKLQEKKGIQFPRIQMNPYIHVSQWRKIYTKQLRRAQQPYSSTWEMLKFSFFP